MRLEQKKQEFQIRYHLTKKKRFMIDLEIAYHPGKANLVADALSRKRVALDLERDVESLVCEVSTLRLCAISQEPLGLEAANQADRSNSMLQQVSCHFQLPWLQLPSLSLLL